MLRRNFHSENDYFFAATDFFNWNFFEKKKNFKILLDFIILYHFILTLPPLFYWKFETLADLMSIGIGLGYENRVKWTPESASQP